MKVKGIFLLPVALTFILPVLRTFDGVFQIADPIEPG